MCRIHFTTGASVRLAALSSRTRIGGQLEAGFVLTGLYEDQLPDPASDPISRYTESFIATRAVKPPVGQVLGR